MIEIEEVATGGGGSGSGSGSASNQVVGGRCRVSGGGVGGRVRRGLIGTIGVLLLSASEVEG